jgi:hypothetical protein
MRTLTSAAALLITVASLNASAVRALSAQEHKQHQTGHTMPPTASAKAQQQIKDVQKATEALATTDGARAAGFMSVLGWIPTMGTHWVNAGRMLTGKGANPAEPSQLMFSPMNGKPTLVGAAYAYYSALNDSTRPATFDGNPAWHNHPDLAPPGTDLVMLHVWFVPSPDGPFAGHNPFLPFWAAGLTPPAEDKMHDDAYNLRVRRAALALGEVVDTAGVFRALSRRPAVKAVLDTERAAVRSLVPQVEAATKAKDDARFDALMVQLGKHWDAMHAAYFASVLRPEVKERMQKLVDDMLRVGGSHH